MERGAEGEGQKKGENLKQTLLNEEREEGLDLTTLRSQDSGIIT